MAVTRVPVGECVCDVQSNVCRCIPANPRDVVAEILAAKSRGDHTGAVRVYRENFSQKVEMKTNDRNTLEDALIALSPDRRNDVGEAGIRAMADRDLAVAVAEGHGKDLTAASANGAPVNTRSDHFLIGFALGSIEGANWRADWVAVESRKSERQKMVERNRSTGKSTSK